MNNLINTRDISLGWKLADLLLNNSHPFKCCTTLTHGKPMKGIHQWNPHFKQTGHEIGNRNKQRLNGNKLVAKSWQGKAKKTLEKPQVNRKIIENAMTKRKKDKQRSIIRYTKNWRWGSTNPTKKQGWVSSSCSISGTLRAKRHEQ